MPTEIAIRLGEKTFSRKGSGSAPPALLRDLLER